MSSIRVWGHPKSINVQKVLWALDELGQDYERIDAGGPFGKVRSPEFLALNPNGLIPTLEDRGVALWESNAILRYLFAQYGNAPEQPLSPLARARADVWTEWYSTTFWPQVRVLLVQLVRTPEDKRDASAIVAATEHLTQVLPVLDAHLSQSPYVAGEHFTFGDIPLGAAAQRWFNLPIKRPVHRHVEAWYGRLKERSAFKRWIDLPLA